MNSFDPFGFTLGDDVGSNVTNYPSGNKHVVYGFKAGGNKGTFNVDDVGYANASDVNMSVGALNSAAYNQNSTWTDDLMELHILVKLYQDFLMATSTGLIHNGTSIMVSPTGFSSISKSLQQYQVVLYTGNARFG